MDAEAKRLAALEEELRKDLEAISRVRHIMALKNGSLSAPDERQLALPISNKHKDTDTADDEDAPQVPSLRDTIDQLLNSDPSVRWTTPKVLSHLQSINYPLRAQKPIYSVGQALQVLTERGIIRCVRRGTGSQPNIYKGKGSAEATLEPANTEKNSQGGSIETESLAVE